MDFKLGSTNQTRGAQPFSYSRLHIFMASGSPWMRPSFVSRCSSRLTSHAMLESWSIVTATLPTEIGALSFSPLRIAAMKFAKCASVMESRPMVSEDEVVLPTLSSLVFFPSRS